MTRPRDLDEIKDTLKAMLPELKSRWPLSYLGVFGSWARREQGKPVFVRTWDWLIFGLTIAGAAVGVYWLATGYITL